MNLENMISEIERVQNELQKMVVEKDCMDDEVMQKAEELEELQSQYNSMLKQML